MAVPLDPLRVYNKGLAGLDQLAGVERLVFMLLDFDNLMEMEGWDHFFLYDHHIAWYVEMKDWLRRIGAATSLAILQEFESAVHSRGFEVSPAGIEELLRSRDEAYDRGCRDWCARYCALREDRWMRATAFLSTQGVSLHTAEGDEAQDLTES